MELLMAFLVGIAVGLAWGAQLDKNDLKHNNKESWDDGPIDTGPKPPPRKSFKERLEEKQSLANHHGHQPTDKVDTSNPPKETGT